MPWTWCCLLNILTLGPAAAAQAQKPPALGYVFPPAIRAGQATAVDLGGFDFTADMQWFVHDERVRLHVLGEPGPHYVPPPPYWFGPRASTPALPIPREVPARLEVDQDAPEGWVRWQVANANGASATAVFYVSRGHEIVESRSRGLPQRLPALPVAVSGRLGRLTEVDRYELVADQDGLLSIDLMARRLGTDLHGVLQVRDVSGTLLADFADTQGVDGGVTFSARAGETYVVSLHDVDFRGDRAYVYRLAVTHGPRVVCTVPAVGQRGTSREVRFVGWGVASGKPVLESTRQVVLFPSDPALIAHRHLLQTPQGAIEVPIPLGDLPELTRDTSTPETSAVDRAATHTIVAPAAVTGVLRPEIDEHRYSWDVAKDESWSIELQSRAIGGRLDVTLSVWGPDGKVVAESDDLPGTPDAGLEFRAAVSGSYTCVVRAVSTRTGNADELYRLQFQRRTADYSLTVAQQQISLPLGGAAEVTVQAARSGGFDGEIELSVDGLPTGVAPQGSWIIPAGQSEHKVTLQAAPDAAVVARAVRFRGAARLGDATATRPATAAASGNLCPPSPTEQRVPAVLLAMTMNPPFEIQLVDRERQREVHRGTTYLAEFVMVRKDGFSGEIQLEMAAQQARYRQGIHGPVIRVPAGADRAVYPCFMPEWLGTDLTRRMVIHGVAAVPDPHGNPRYLMKPADARITMIMEGALLKLTTEARAAAACLGEPLDVPIVISRSAKLPIATTIELVVPDEVVGLLHAAPLVLPPGSDHGTLRITSAVDARLVGLWSLKLTATALQDGQWPVISETELPVTFSIR